MVMTIAENMQKLAEDIIVSSDVRLKAVGDLMTDTRRTLNGFSRDRKKMAAQQSKDLANFTGGLSKNVQGMLKSARNMVERFGKDNTKMSEEQAKSLADFVHDLVTNVGSMLGGFQKDHGRMSRDLRNKLDKELKDIHAEVHNILDNTDKLMHEYKTDMARARKAWKSVSSAFAGAGRCGSTEPQIKPAKKTRTVKKASGKTRAKDCHPCEGRGRAKGRKGRTSGNNGSKRKAGAGV